MQKNFWTAQLVQQATNGIMQGPMDWSSSSFCLDSRGIEKGQMFIALRGENVDGHDFITQAIAKGAVAVIVDRSNIGVSKDFPILTVPDCMQALIALAKARRKAYQGKIIGITGSAGKTSTKDMLALCLESQFKTYKSQKSFNSQSGLPLVLANMPTDTEIAILEMGMNQAGEISFLSQLVQPDIAIITTISPAHLEFLKSMENIAQAKAEIFDHMPSTGIAIINGDLPETSLIVQHASQQGLSDILLFGETQQCDSRLISYRPTELGCHIDAIIEKKISYTLQTFGKHHALNSLAVLTVAQKMGASMPITLNALKDFTESDRRGKAYHLKNSVLLVDESYNANPSSMKAAMLAFNERPVSGKRILVLGDMKELGPQAEFYHRHIKETLDIIKVDFLITYGQLMNNLHQEMEWGHQAHHFNDLEKLWRYLEKIIRPGDGVFVKSSKSVMLNLITEKIRELYAV